MAGKKRLVHQLVEEGVAGDLDVVGQAHLGQDAGVVGADGFGADGEFGGDFLEGHAFGDHEHDLMLTGGKGFVQRNLGAALGVGGEAVGQGGADVASAGQDVADGGDQFLGGALFVDVAGGA